MSKRILALDIGTVRIGVAMTSPTGDFALPVETIHIKKSADPVEDIRKLLEQNDIQHIVVGLPLDLDGSEGAAVRRTKQFVAKLRQRIPNIKIFAQDERFTSSVAENVLMDLETKGEKKKLLVDSMAATLILQTWLDKQAARKESAANHKPT